MDNIVKKLEVAANCCIILVAIVVVGVLVKKYLLTTPAVTDPEVSVGTRITLAGVNWGENGQTLVVVSQTGCHFCSESAPFYQRLVQEAKTRGNVRLVFVLPQPVAEGQKYLNDLGLFVSDIVQAPLKSIQVRGTPTLLLVNNKGVVMDLWLGKLPPEKEAEVLGKLQCEDCGS